MAHIDDRNQLASLVRATGTRWVATATLVIICALALIQLIWFHSAPWGWRLGYLMPVLVVSVLNMLNIEWNLNLFEWKSMPGKNYFYCEATGEGWKIGELPREFRPPQIKVIPVALVERNRVGREDSRVVKTD